MRIKSTRLNLTRRGGSLATSRRLRYPFFVCVFLAAGLLILSRINHSYLLEVRNRIAAVTTPVIDAAMVPFEPIRRAGQRLAEQVDLSEEVERLRRENQKLAGWEWRAHQLQRRIADLEALNKVVPEQQIPFVTSRVIGESSGAFGQTILIDAGRQNNVTPGFPVIDANGLVGRVIHASDDVSRVLLLTDLNSRVPVSVGKSEYRALLAGDATTTGLLIYLPEDARITNGDDVWTSGVGGGFPRGLRIGSVTRVAGQLRVKLRARLDRLEHVSILRFDAVESLPSDDSRSMPTQSSVKPSPSPSEVAVDRAAGEATQ